MWGVVYPFSFLHIEKVDAMDTYYEGQNVERFLKHTMEFLYARTILELLNDVVKENCFMDVRLTIQVKFNTHV